MNRTTRILASFFFLHAILVCFGAFQFEFFRLGPVGNVFKLYGDLTGSGSGYGFFAPGVGSQLRAEFDVFDANGNKTVATLLTGANHESNLRIGNIVTSLYRMADDEKMRRALVASWAGKIFARYPEATEVVVRIESLTPVSTKEYREGLRRGWEPFYRAKFTYDRHKNKEAS